MSAPNGAAIHLSRLSKVYRLPAAAPWSRGGRKTALAEVSFSCPAGKVTCLLGPNGAGKTTIIKILAGLVLADGGEASVLGIPLEHAPLSLRARVGVCTPNERSFYWRLTGRQNLLFFASLCNLRGRERRERVEEALRDVEFEEQADKPFRLYSTGMRQKMALARALLSRPEVLLLDEPTAHLDPLVRSNVQRIIAEKLVGQRRATVLLCTHDLHEAQALGQHLVMLHNGRVLVEGSLDALRARMRVAPRIVCEFASLPPDGWEKAVPTARVARQGNRLVVEVGEEGHIPLVVNAAISAGGRLNSCEREEMSLAALFDRFVNDGNGKGE